VEDRTVYRKKIEDELDQCSSRLKELKGKAKSEELLSDIEDLETEVRTCKLELAKIENRSDDEWVDMKHSLTRRLDSVRRGLHLSARKLI
jgi:predicted  nucleic acid-binding Zn-ribbon protein